MKQQGCLGMTIIVITMQKRLKSVGAMTGMHDDQLDKAENMATPSLLKIINKKNIVKDGMF